ncbi:MAG TPA: alpha/beta fold hydrolase [Ktedonobacterales bacterium]
MGAQGKYAAERVGDWGIPAAEGYSEATFTASNGDNLFYRRWLSDAAAPTLVLLHGLGAHSGWFIDMGEELHTHGLTVCAIDHRGFGRSGGPRGHVRDGSLYPRDITAFLTFLRGERPASPLYILGHSMGALFALNVAAEGAARAQPLVTGLIIVNPWIDDQKRVSPLTVSRLLASGLAGSSKPFTTGDTATMTTNPEALAMLEGDTFWVRAESAAFLYQVTRMRLAAIGRAKQVRAPALVIQCEADKAVKPAASRQMYDALGSADKTWMTYAGFAHDFEFEPERARLDADVAQWIKAHSA